MRPSTILLSLAILFVVVISYRIYDRSQQQIAANTFASGGQTKNITKEIDFRSPGEDMYLYKSTTGRNINASKISNQNSLTTNNLSKNNQQTTDDLTLVNNKTTEIINTNAEITSNNKLPLLTSNNQALSIDNNQTNQQTKQNELLPANFPEPSYIPSVTANSSQKAKEIAQLAPSQLNFFASEERVTEDKLAATWRPSCPVPIEELRLLKISYWDFAMQSRIGEIIVHQSISQKIKNALHDLWKIKFQINRMQTLDQFVTYEDFISDGRVKMDNHVPDLINNTSAFFCRESTVKKNYWSEHSYGMAIDINPVQNPFVTPNNIWPINGKSYLQRNNPAIGKIHTNSPVIKIMQNHGFKWGGNWSRSHDYMHFSITGK